MDAIKIICYQLPKSELCFLDAYDFGSLNIHLIGIYDEVPEFVATISTTSPNIILLNSLTSTVDLYFLINELKIVAPNAIKILWSTIYSKFILNEVLGLGIHKVIHKSIKSELLIKEILLLMND
ncbi:MAG: hypothetical protein WAU01_09830 [Saprospiraceae bacterium]